MAASGLADDINGGAESDSLNKSDEKLALKASLLKLDIATGAIDDEGMSLKESVQLLKAFMGSAIGVGETENKYTGSVDKGGQKLPNPELEPGV